MRDRLSQTWDRLSQLRDRLIAVFFETIDAEQAKIAKDLTTPPNLLKCRCVKGLRCVECGVLNKTVRIGNTSSFLVHFSC